MADQDDADHEHRRVSPGRSNGLDWDHRRLGSVSLTDATRPPENRAAGGGWRQWPHRLPVSHKIKVGRI